MPRRLSAASPARARAAAALARIAVGELREQRDGTADELQVIPLTRHAGDDVADAAPVVEALMQKS